MTTIHRRTAGLTPEGSPRDWRYFSYPSIDRRTSLRNSAVVSAVTLAGTPPGCNSTLVSAIGGIASLNPRLIAGTPAGVWKLLSK